MKPTAAATARTDEATPAVTSLVDAMTWPNGARSCVCLAFDLDGPTGAALQGDAIWHSARLFTQGGYGPFRGLPRLLDLLARYELPATFFVPGWVVETWPDACARIVADGHEVAGHGHRHENFFDLSVEQQHEVLGRSQAALVEHLGAPAAGFRTPSGDWHQQTPALLVEHGYRYSSSMRDDHGPYRHDLPGAPGPLVEIPARVDLDDYAYFAYTTEPAYPRGQDRISDYDVATRNWQREFDGHHEVGGCLTTVWHPKVTGTPGRALALEGLFDHLAQTPEVWFATGTQVADHVLASDGGGHA